jgi:uncharacterized protein YpmS
LAGENQGDSRPAAETLLSPQRCQSACVDPADARPYHSALPLNKQSVMEQPGRPSGPVRILDSSPMARKFRIAAIVVFAAVGIVAATLGSIYWAMGRVRPFYSMALQLEPATLEVGSRELESRATVLYSEARQPGPWQAAFTAEQINGWLALQLAEVYGDALPDEFSEPRVAIDDDRFTLGFRARRGGVDTVVSADASVMLTENGEIAIRLKSLQAGALPLPIMQIADEISRACQELSLPVRWTQDAGEPVALVDVNQDAAKAKRIHLDTIELRDGAVYLAGHTVDDEAEFAEFGLAKPQATSVDEN